MEHAAIEDDDEDREPTGRTMQIRAAGARGDVAELARALERMQRSIDKLGETEAKRAGASTVWRWAGGIAATVAIAIGSAALGLAQDAAVDHDRLGAEIARGDREQTRVDGLASDLGEVRRDQAGTSATLVEVRTAIVDVRDEVRALRREVAERDRRR
jgi:hypothetical protein